MQTRRTTITFPIDLYTIIAEEAEKNNRSFSGQVIFMLHNNVLRMTGKRRPLNVSQLVAVSDEGEDVSEPK